MSNLIAKDPDYIRRLRQHPQITIYSRIENVQPWDSVLAVPVARDQFIASRPHYVAALNQRPVAEFEHYQRYEKPAIVQLSGKIDVYVNSAAGSYEISLLKNYIVTKNALETYYPKIQVKA